MSTPRLPRACVPLAKTPTVGNREDGGETGHLEFTLALRGISYQFAADGLFYPAQQDVELTLANSGNGDRIAAADSLSLVYQAPVTPDSTVRIETDRVGCKFEYDPHSD